MVEYRFLRTTLVAAAPFIPALGALAQLGLDSDSFASAVVPLAKRDPLIEVQGGYFQRYPNEGIRHGTQGWAPTKGHRYTIINEAGETLWAWIEITVSAGNTVRIIDPNGPWAEKIRLGPGESVQIGNIPTHSGTARAYARCNEIGENCAGDLGAATKWAWTTDPSEHVGNIGINLSLGRSSSIL